MVLHREKTRTMVLCAMFVVLIAAGAWIKIPVPVVPFTLQYLFTMLAGILLGGRRGALAVCVYLALGLAGLPIFAQGGGLSYLLQPSFGYLIGFAAGAFVTGTMARSIATILLLGYFFLIAFITPFPVIWFGKQAKGCISSMRR